MRVLYSTQAVVQFDGKHYYSNSVQSTYKRYTIFKGKIVCLSYIKRVEKGTEDMVDDGALEFIPIAKINTLKSLLFKKKRNKDIVEKEVAKADVCIAHIPAGHSYDVISYSKKYNKPFMTVVVGCSWDSMWNYNWKGKLLALSSYLDLKKAQKDAPYSIYVTNDFLQKRYPTKGKWIGCSNVNLSTGVEGVLDNRINQINLRKKSNKTLIIGTAAALDVPYKGQEYVIKALGMLKKQNIDFEYHLVGGGSGNSLAEAAKISGVEDRVFIHGRIPHEQISQFLDGIDIYIQPSKQEGLPRATIEAMSRGCLCMGSNIAGIPELLESRFLFEKGDVKGIVKILKEIDFDECENQAIRNFDEAKKYDKDILNERRSKFINEFKESFCR